MDRGEAAASRRRRRGGRWRGGPRSRFPPSTSSTASLSRSSPAGRGGWYTPPSIRLWSAARKRLGSRWASRTSNPASGSRQVGGGFDSHTLPPCVPTREHTMNTRKADATASGATSRRSRGLWLAIGGVAAAAVVAGAIAYQAAGAQPGVSFPDQGNRHVMTLKESIPLYNSEPP